MACDLQKRITEHGQEHVLNFWDELTVEQQRELERQLTNIDFELLDKLEIQNGKNDIGQLVPSPVIKLDESQRKKGIEAIENGELAVLTVAGGQGTRLGWSGPKGTFPATPITGKSLFQLVAEQIVFASKKYNVSIPWYIMTSNENDAVTRAFLLDNNCFGIERTDIFIFSQGEMPAVDSDGKILLASKFKLAMNPDGHGGVIVALKNSGALEEMDVKGVKYLSYVQIDNPLAQVVDPDFLGMHLSGTSSIEVTSKCVPKSCSEERVGVFCHADGKTTVVEYSDLPDKLAEEVDEQGALRFSAGSIAIHMMSTDFLQRVVDDLPWHKANKIVPHIDAKTGASVVPTNPNGYKFERFVFDILPFAKHSLVVETRREEEFAPIKNATGCDSAKTSQVLQNDRAVRWLKMNNVEVSDSATVEISPLVAASPDDLLQISLPHSISTDEIVVI